MTKKKNKEVKKPYLMVVYIFFILWTMILITIDMFSSKNVSENLITLIIGGLTALITLYYTGSAVKKKIIDINKKC